MAINMTAGSSLPPKMVAIHFLIVGTHSICGSKWTPIGVMWGCPDVKNHILWPKMIIFHYIRPHLWL